MNRTGKTNAKKGPDKDYNAFRDFHDSSPVSLSVFSLVPDLLFDCSRLLEYAKIRTVLQSTCHSDDKTS